MVPSLSLLIEKPGIADLGYELKREQDAPTNLTK